MLHGAGDDAEDARAYGWDDFADREGFVVVYPNGIGNSWNGGACCRTAAERNIDDVGYLSELSRRVSAEDGTDPLRVFAAGMSNGGIVAYAWACARPGDLAGIGIVSGGRLVDCPAPGPLAVVAMHGTDDQAIPLSGGLGAGGGIYPPLNGALRPFLTAAACSAAPEIVADGDATVSIWGCSTGSRIIRDALQGYQHVWPRGGPTGALEGPTNATWFLWNELVGDNAT